MAKQKITQREQPGVQAVVSLADLGLSQVAERRELSPIGFATCSSFFVAELATRDCCLQRPFRCCLFK